MLKYIGRGDWLPDVPARDLTDEEAEQYGGVAFLCSTGLYVSLDAPKMERPRRANKMERPDTEDKGLASDQPETEE